MRENLEEIKKSFIKTNGLKEASRSVRSELAYLIPKRLLFLERGIGFTGGLEYPEWDHVSYWSKDRKPYCVVLQPYWIGEDGMRKIVRVCDDYNLKATVSGWSWHHPSCSLLVFTRKQ